MKDNAGFGDSWSAGLIMRPSVGAQIKMAGNWVAECYGPDGELKWRQPFTNRVVDVGLTHALETELGAGSQNSTWFVGIIASTNPTIAAGDTMASHAGWTESTAYSSTSRPKFSPGAAANKQISSTASPASFSINATAKFGGAFLTTSNDKGGTTGTLYAAAKFTTSTGGTVVKSADSGDTLQVKATYTASAT